MIKTEFLYLRLIEAIDSEPEYPGEPPQKLKELFQEAIDNEDTDMFIKAMRMTVKLTKDGIRKRVEQFLDGV